MSNFHLQFLLIILHWRRKINIPYHTVPCRTMPCHAMPYHAMPCHTIPYHTIPYHTIPYHTISYHKTSSSRKYFVMWRSPFCVQVTFVRYLRLISRAVCEKRKSSHASPSSALNCSTSLASTTFLGKEFQSTTTLWEKLNFLKFSLLVCFMILIP